MKLIPNLLIFLINLSYACIHINESTLQYVPCTNMERYYPSTYIPLLWWGSICFCLDLSSIHLRMQVEIQKHKFFRTNIEMSDIGLLSKLLSTEDPRVIQAIYGVKRPNSHLDWKKFHIFQNRAKPVSQFLYFIIPHIETGTFVLPVKKKDVSMSPLVSAGAQVVASGKHLESNTGLELWWLFCWWPVKVHLEGSE